MKAIFLLLLLASVSQAAPQFIGFVETREQGAIFAIAPSSDTPSRWVKIGDDVVGYHVTRFDAKEKVLVLKKDGREIALRLKDSKIRDGSIAAFETRIVDVARKLVSKMDRWESDVLFQAAEAGDGFWYVFATKIVDGKKQVRLVRLKPDATATNYSILTADDPK